MLKQAFKLHHLFFLNFSLIIGGTFLLSGLVSYAALKDSFREQTLTILYNDAMVLADFLKHSFDPKLVAALSYPEGHSVLLIDSRGQLLDASTLQPKKLPLIQQIRYALTHHEGVLQLHEEQDGRWLYCVAPVNADDSVYYVLVGQRFEGMGGGFDRLWFQIVAIFLFSVLIGLVVTHLLNQNIKHEMKRITEFVSNIANKKYRYKNTPAFSEEFSVILGMLSKLSKKIEKRDKKIRKYTASLRLKNQQNGEIISAISHEFKNPAAIILGYSQTLTEDKEMSDSIRDRFLEKIAANAQKISLLIDRLALSVKLENKGMEPNIGTFNLYEVCQDVKTLLEERYKDRVVEICGQSRFAEADKTLIELVLVNLADNALKYSDDDIVIEIDEGRVKVLDQGIGIAEEDIKQITEKFFRVDKNSWNTSLGLGLSIVKYILKLHDSKLRIESTPGQGSTFWFEI